MEIPRRWPCGPSRHHLQSESRAQPCQPRDALGEKEEHPWQVTVSPLGWRCDELQNSISPSVIGHTQKTGNIQNWKYF